ncbi:MAG: FAD binding domain-containing protein [Deltaproteobacteria bacterium]|nr:FAD binding domain-containing protein [Deltaproteobacteria bacterium]
MLRLPKFRVLEPRTVEEALSALAEHGDRARILAGGTDLLPNMKHELETPEVVVSLQRIDSLREIVEHPGHIELGPLNTLHELSRHPLLSRYFPSLAEACAEVAGPQLRRMGTIGGNVCLDTRCVFVNQTYFWRQALGFCLKKDGTVCHVVAGGRRCVAAASNDSGPVLMSLGASLELASASGVRTLSIDEFYVQDGTFNQARARNELLASIKIPKPAPGTIMAYQKLRTRAAIDFPELGVAVLAERNGHGIAERVEVCLTALASRPVRVQKLLTAYSGKPLDAQTIGAIARVAHDRARPLTNLATDPDYRREMVPVIVRRAFKVALERGPHRAEALSIS